MKEVLSTTYKEMEKFLLEKDFEEIIKSCAYEMRDLYIKEKGEGYKLVAYDGIFNTIMNIVEEIGHNNQ